MALAYGRMNNKSFMQTPAILNMHNIFVRIAEYFIL